MSLSEPKNTEPLSGKGEILLTIRKSLQIEKNWERGFKAVVGSMHKLGFEKYGFFMVNPVKNALEYWCGRGVGFSNSNKFISLKKSSYCGVKCVLEKKLVRDDHLQGDEFSSDKFDVWVPIIVQKEVFAVLAASRVSDERFKDEGISTLEFLAEMFSGFIEKKRMKAAPVPEETRRKKVNHWLNPSECCIIVEKKPSKSFELFTDLVTHSVPGFVISRQHPERIRREYKLEKTPILWLSRSGVKAALSPDDALRLKYMVRSFTRKSEESVILLDGLEYIIIQTSFESALNSLEALKDTIATTNSRLIVPLHKGVLSPQEFSTLEREFTIIFSQPPWGVWWLKAVVLQKDT